MYNYSIAFFYISSNSQRCRYNFSKSINKLPSSVLGAAWKPQEERMNAGIYFPLYLVLVCKKEYSVFYLASDLQNKEIFVARKPLSASARRAGWQGFMYDISKIKNSFVRLI